MKNTGPLLPALALMLNALVWGTSWWPFRRLESNGLHPLWATTLIYAVAVGVIVILRPRAVMQLVRTPALWVLLLASGTTNAAFNWSMVIGDVVRVVLLFYLMPLWAVLLARLLLNEPLTRGAGLRIALALAGAAVVLWPSGAGGSGVEEGVSAGWAGMPLPRSLPDWLGLLGGLAFALNNVMLRREAHRPEEGRALAMFAGGALVAGVLAWVLASSGAVRWPPPAAPGWLAIVGVLVVLFLVSNLTLQYGAARLPANVTAVVMLTEVLFSSVSAVLLGAGTLSAPLLVGGALIVLAAGLAALEPERVDAVGFRPGPAPSPSPSPPSTSPPSR